MKRKLIYDCIVLYALRCVNMPPTTSFRDDLSLEMALHTEAVSHVELMFISFVVCFFSHYFSTSIYG